MSEINVIELDRETGINAIIALQFAVGIVETRERAEISWDSFSQAEKEQTMYVYDIMYKNII